MRVCVLQGVHLYSGGAGLSLVRDQAEDAHDERRGKGNIISKRNVTSNLFIIRNEKALQK